jgi:hypothetical protein
MYIYTRGLAVSTLKQCLENDLIQVSLIGPDAILIYTIFDGNQYNHIR